VCLEVGKVANGTKSTQVVQVAGRVATSSNAEKQIGAKKINETLGYCYEILGQEETKAANRAMSPSYIYTRGRGWLT
jgi:hypothetical protein